MKETIYGKISEEGIGPWKTESELMPETYFHLQAVGDYDSLGRSFSLDGFQNERRKVGPSDYAVGHDKANGRLCHAAVTMSVYFKTILIMCMLS